jgi:autotransporter-associated beta strand protein
MNAVRPLWAVVAAILLMGQVDAAPLVVYDSINFYTSGADGYGFLGITSLDKSAIYGDSLRLTATGKLTSFTWVAFNGPNASYDLTSASQTISFYRQSDNSLIGSFNATITDLGTGTSKTYTADLGSANIVLDTPDVLVTQQIPFWPPGAPNYKLGTVIATTSNTPAIGSTDVGSYRSQFGGPLTKFTWPGYPNYSSAVYKAVVLPDVTWNTTSGTWNTSTANWTTGSGPNDTFSDGSQATFNNASGGVVTLSGALAPRAVVVSATGGSYAFLSTAGNEITGAATLSKSGDGTLLLYGPNSYSGGTTLNGGTLALGHADAIGASGTISFGGGTLRYSESNTTDYSARFSNAASQQYKIDTSGETVTLASNLTSSGGSFTKLGSGTVTLTGANTYSGATTVSGGLLNLNSATGSAAGGTTSVAVASGATLLLSQSDQVNNAATVSLSGGTIRRGGNVGEVFGNLTISTASFLDYGAANDAGTIRFGTYAPSALLTVQNFLPGNKLQFGNTISSTDLNNTSLFQFSNGFTTGTESGFFTITAIPEPSTYLAALGLLALMLWPLRRRS